MEIKAGGGTFHEYFDRDSGWQDRIRNWVQSMTARFNLKPGTVVSMWHAANRVTFSFVKDMAI